MGINLKIADKCYPHNHSIQLGHRWYRLLLLLLIVAVLAGGQSVSAAELSVNANQDNNAQNYISYKTGFWKKNGPDARSGHDAWRFIGFDPDDFLCYGIAGGIFDCSLASSDVEKHLLIESRDTMMGALYLKGGNAATGAAESLLRAATTSYLNAFINDLWAGQDGFGQFPLYADNQSCQDRSGLSAAECESLNVVDLVNAAITFSAIDPNDEAAYRQRMLALSVWLDDINSNGSQFFDWTWGLGGP